MMAAVDWSRAWFCIWTDHNGHTGCNTDMLWLSDLYDYASPGSAAVRRGRGHDRHDHSLIEWRPPIP